MLEKQRIAKLKESLNQEKSLINERLNARKNAVDQADQYEELAEYKRQLALLSADPTRTKEAKELQKRIADMEKDMAYQTAAAEATAEGERIDDQMKAYDDYINNAQEDLNMLLADSTALMADAQDKFGYNVAELMAGSWVDLLTWLQENNDAYRNATEELQTQMVNSWEDTWKKMNGIIDTYWEEISAIIGDETTFMDYMKESDTYKAASDTGKLSLEYRWEDSFEDMLAALVDNADYDHEHDLITDLSSKLDEAKDWTYKVELAGATKDLIGSFALSDYSQYGLEHTPVDVSDIFWDDLYAGVGKVVEEYFDAPSGPPGGGEEEEGPSGSGKKTWDVYDEKGFKTYYTVKASSREEADRIVKEQYGNYYSAATHTETPSGGGTPTTTQQQNANRNNNHSNSNNNNRSNSNNNSSNTSNSNRSNNSNSNNNQTDNRSNAANAVVNAVTSALSGVLSRLVGTRNAEGGVVDYTGIAWVDGTFSKPEAFLDATDTKHIAELTDMLNHVDLPAMTLPNLGDFGIHNQTIGDINITINQAELGSDADVDAVARKVGKAFSKQLSKQGLNLAQYAF